MSDQLRQIAIEVLIGAADAALIYFCYRLYKDKCSAAEHIQVKYDNKEYMQVQHLLTFVVTTTINYYFCCRKVFWCDG
mgnify:CR=1 FL=1